MSVMNINLKKWALKVSIFNVTSRLVSSISITICLLVLGSTSYASVIDKYKYNSFQDNNEHYKVLVENNNLIEGMRDTINGMSQSHSQDPAPRDYIIYLHDKFLPSKYPTVLDIGSGLG